MVDEHYQYKPHATEKSPFYFRVGVNRGKPVVAEERSRNGDGPPVGVRHYLLKLQPTIISAFYV